MAIKLTWLTWFKASASNFWFIPHKFATFFWHLWCTFIPHSKRNVRIVIQASGKYRHYNKCSCFLCTSETFFKANWTWTCHCYQNCSFYPLTQWRLKNVSQGKKPPIIITLFSKSVTIKNHLAFLWENYKSNVYSKRFEHTFRCYVESVSKFQLFPK